MPESRPHNTRRALFWMVVVALAIRLAVMAFVYPERLNPARDHWKFAGETGRIARSLAEGHGFSNPFFAETGPTSWLAPVFPAVLAGDFKIFGVYTKASALAILSLDCLLGALTCIPVFFIARRTFGDHAAIWAGWIWAFFPYSINFAASFIWDTTLSTLLMALLFLAILKLENVPRWWPSFGFGALAGFAALTNPVLLGAMPFLTLWMLYRYWKRGERWFAPGLAALLAVIIVVSPWFVRNYRTFHEFIPLRGGLGFEFYCGNNADSWHWDPPGYHPSDSKTEWNEYQQLGEMDYFALKKREAFAFIGAHKKLYAIQTLRRVVYIWTGFWSFTRRYLQQEPFDPPNILFCTALTILAFLGLWRARLGFVGPDVLGRAARLGFVGPDVLSRAARLDNTSGTGRQNTPAPTKTGGAVSPARREGSPRRAGAVPYVIVFIVFPLIYYVTHPEDYYRRPIDPMIVALAAGALASWRERKVLPT